MSWHCPRCAHAHARQYGEPTLCRACEVRKKAEAEITQLKAERDEALDLLEQSLPQFTPHTSNHELAVELLGRLRPRWDHNGNGVIDSADEAADYARTLEEE